jgi:hypothetical protein
MTRLQLKRSEWDALRSHLLQNDVEQAAIAFARPAGLYDGSDDVVWTNDSGPRVLQIVETYCCTAADFSFQSAFHIALTDEAQARLIKRAWDLGAAFIELHSHVGFDSSKPTAAAPAKFSPSDLSGFEEFVPHVRWRLRGAPYVAIVVTDAEFDAMVWDGESKLPMALVAVDVDGEALTPSGRTLEVIAGGGRVRHSPFAEGRSHVG